MKKLVVFGAFMLMFTFSSCLKEDNGPDTGAQLEKEIKAIDDYLTANPGSPTDIIVKDASGIRLVITEMGTGTIPPNQGNNLKVAYTGRLFSDGTIFDSNPSYLLKLSDNIINGWKIGLSLITKGTKAKLYIPSYWGYGPTGNTGIPANATLVFDLNLIEVESTAQQQTKLQDDIAAIDAYLATNNITAEQHGSGIRYVITEPGLGDSPSMYDQIKVNYKGSLLSNGNVFYDGPLEPSPQYSSRLVNYVHGLIIGLPLLKEGGKAKFYVPSGLAFGTVAYADIPANSNVVFEIELLDVIE